MNDKSEVLYGCLFVFEKLRGLALLAHLHHVRKVCVCLSVCV